jgi:pimeloyl-ACP methyl ester carboxylesterase
MGRRHRSGTRSSVVVGLVLAVLGATAGLVGVGPATAAPAPRPVLFVHGFAGSANQYGSQAQRFESNGYPTGWVTGIDYDSTFGVAPMAEVWNRIDEAIADLRARSGVDQVDLVGHSLGTGVSQGYLNSSPERAASVAHYVNLDGASAAAPPGGVDTLAVWGMGNPARTVTGAENVSFPEQTHTEVVTSPQSFGAVYEFLTGEAPATTDVVREPADQVEIAGRAQLFPSNVAASDVALEVHEVDPATGYRLDATPEATPAVAADGTWGPVAVDGDARYELALVRGGGTSTHHFYFEPFARDDHLVRLLTSEPGTGLDALWERGPGHSNIVMLRMKEWWGDQGERNDSLTIDGTELIIPETAPISKRAIAVFAYDAGADGVSTPDAAIPAFFSIPFLTAMDVHLAASQPPADTISVVETPRLGDGRVVTINVPNWPSDTDRISIQFLDYHWTADPPPAQAPGSTTSTVASTTTTSAAAATATPRFTG